MKVEYEKFQKGQSQIQIPTDVGQQIDPQTGLLKEAQITPYQFEIEGINKRLEAVKAIGIVDYSFIISDGIEQILEHLQPDVVVKGKEHENATNPEKNIVQSYYQIKFPS